MRVLNLFFVLCFFGSPFAQATVVANLKVTVLSTMLADQGIGEWGFAALVEADGQQLLIDTGARPDTVLQNARELGIDLSHVQAVVLTHFHADHIGGLLTLRSEMQKRDPTALSVTHVGTGIFYSRPMPDGDEDNKMIALQSKYEATGAAFVEHDGVTEIMPGIWITGPVPRLFPEHNWSGSEKVQTPLGLVEDTIPDDQSVIIETTRGLVIITGCGHAGIVNIVADANAHFKRLSVTPDAKPERGLFYRADHFSLAKRGVPTLLFMAIGGGVDLVNGGRSAGDAWVSDYIAHCYHQTCDTWSPSWDLRGAAQDVDLFYRIGLELGNSRRWPEWRATSEFKAIRDSSASARP